MPRKLTYGTYYPWNQTVDSFVAALAEGCQLCNLIEENRSYKQESSVHFPVDIAYSFKSLSSAWARHGNGPKWMVPYHYRTNEMSEMQLYLEEVERDPTPNGLGHLLATDSDELERTSTDFWLVLEFYGPLSHLVLPLEFIRQGSYTRPS